MQLVSPDFFFFKQKTAYEMRISDWSSDVCSSDLHAHVTHRERLRADDLGKKCFRSRVAVEHAVLRAFLVIHHDLQRDASAVAPPRLRRPSAVADRKRVVLDRGVLCLVIHGGRRITKKKNENDTTR